MGNSSKRLRACRTSRVACPKGYENESELLCDGGVSGHQGLHDDPAYQVGHGTDTEDDHVAGGLALETSEGKGLSSLLGIGEECAGAFVDEE